MGEAYADGEVSAAALTEVCIAVNVVCPRNSIEPRRLAAWVAHAATFPVRDRFNLALDRVIYCYDDAATASGDPDAEYAAQADLLRDIFGNPFRPVVFDPAWGTDTAVSLAKHVYESRDFSAMPILADSLQDAGCENADVLTHCRDEKQPHVRGCWVVDLVLGKA
jgi:hypothetical protein